ncbi:MAG: hypothetical protein D6808_03065, partial [Candidatus Dadabacteria bacterium]
MKKACIFSIVFILSAIGCSPSNNSSVVNLGAAGTIVGAGTGAMVGSLIKNGSVPKSAGLG